MKNILLTGGSGRLANYVAPYLQDLGYNVTLTDIVTPKPDSENAKRGLPFVKADLLNIGDIMKAIAMSECDAIVHLGAIPFNVELQKPYEKVSGEGGALHDWKDRRHPAPAADAAFPHSPRSASTRNEKAQADRLMLHPRWT